MKKIRNLLILCGMINLLSLKILAETSVKNPLLQKKNDSNNLDDELGVLSFYNALFKATIEKNTYDKYKELLYKLEGLKIEKEYAIVQAEFETLTLKNAKYKVFHAIQDEYEKISLETELLKAKLSKQIEEFKSISFEKQKKIDEERMNCEAMTAQLQTLKLQGELADQVVIKDSDKYLLNPILKNGNIRISDRRINLNGVITSWKANYIVDMINYYNNKNSKYPIFVVIDSSPGGSLNAGNRIISAISSSCAPVYVVVTGYAASMSAVITTLAERSFVLKDSLLTHHLSHITLHQSINLRQAKDLVKELSESTKRLTESIAAKMGITLENYIKQMFEKNTEGDWTEYGNNAIKLKWATGIINGVEDVNVDKKPDMRNYSFIKYKEEFFGYVNNLESRENSNLHLDEYEINGKKMQLPKLYGNDFYYMYVK